MILCSKEGLYVEYCTTIALGSNFRYLLSNFDMDLSNSSIALFNAMFSKTRLNLNLLNLRNVQ